MKRLRNGRKAIRYVWHGLARLGEMMIFVILLPMILVGAAIPERSNRAVPSPAKTATTQSQPRP